MSVPPGRIFFSLTTNFVNSDFSDSPATANATKSKHIDFALQRSFIPLRGEQRLYLLKN
jgi:hypothetical protein